MIKKLMVLCLSLTLLLCSSVFTVASAATTTQGEYLLRNVMINGQNIPNYKLKNPILAYNGYIYVAMDEKMGDLLGVSAALDSGSKTLKVTPRSRGWVDFAKESVQNDLDNLTLTVKSDISLAVVTAENPGGVKVNSSSCPVMLYGSSVYYIPLNALVDSGKLGWSLDWNNYTGAFVSTDSSIPASYYNDPVKAQYKAGLIAYIMKKNPYIGRAKAEEIDLYCCVYGSMYGGLDEELLLSICETESTFYENVRSTRYYGLMQVKDSNGAAYGYTTSQLYQAKHNIHMGCIMLDHAVKTFNGNMSLALSGYAYGEYAVQKGSFALKYYNNWMKKYYNMIAFASAYQA